MFVRVVGFPTRSDLIGLNGDMNVDRDGNPLVSNSTTTLNLSNSIPFLVYLLKDDGTGCINITPSDPTMMLSNIATWTYSPASN